MGWTHKAWRSYKRKLGISAVVFMVAFSASLEFMDTTIWRLGMIALFVPVFVLLERSFRIRFENSATPTDEQRAAFSDRSRAGNNLAIAFSIIIVPAMLVFISVEIRDALPEWFKTVVRAVLFLTLILLVVLSGPTQRRFEDTLSPFRGSLS